MKYLALSAFAISSLFAGQASAQIYDNVTGVTSVSYFGPSTSSPIDYDITLMGDDADFVIDPLGPASASISSFDVVVVVTAAGTYDLTMSSYNGNCFANLEGGATGSLTFTPADGPYPAAFVVSSTLSTPVSSMGPNSRFIEFRSSSTNMTFGIADHAPTVGGSVNGFFMDVFPSPPPLDGILTCDDFITLNGFTNANLAFALYGTAGNKAHVPANQWHAQRLNVPVFDQSGFVRKPSRGPIVIRHH